MTVRWQRAALLALWLLVVALSVATVAVSGEEWYWPSSPFTTDQQFAHGLARTILFPLTPLLLAFSSMMTWAWLGGRHAASRRRPRGFIALLWLAWIAFLLALPMLGRVASSPPVSFGSEYNLSRVVGGGALAIGLIAFALSALELLSPLAEGLARLHPGQLAMIWLLAIIAGTAAWVAWVALPIPLRLWDSGAVAMAVPLLGTMAAAFVVPVVITWQWFGARTAKRL